MSWASRSSRQWRTHGGSSMPRRSTASPSATTTSRGGGANSMAREKKTVVLTSRENFVWLSMQEIVPLIESCWLGSARKGRHQVIVLDVDRLSIPELLPELMSADNVVFTCFTVRLARIGELL